MPWTAIVAKAPEPAAFLGAFKKRLRPVVKLIKKDFDKIVRTWSHKPDFPEEIKVSKHEVLLNVYVESSWSPGKTANANDIFRFNSRGTKVRFATMTGNFSAKSQKGLIGSRGGSGGVLFISKKRPRPGIKARKHEETVKAHQKPLVTKGSQLALEQAAKDIDWSL
jgi:hypothetical protein